METVAPHGFALGSTTSAWVYSAAPNTVGSGGTCKFNNAVPFQLNTAKNQWGLTRNEQPGMPMDSKPSGSAIILQELT